jgi:hypothetical protein
MQLNVFLVVLVNVLQQIGYINIVRFHSISSAVSSGILPLPIGHFTVCSLIKCVSISWCAIYVTTYNLCQIAKSLRIVCSLYDIYIGNTLFMSLF